ncbi:MAG TPA: DUF4350 domain-containing protein [Acidimicrobiales bacterium]|nr:DUF4350 domain-containing protein [Acidimicrobiales bacterium]
MTTLDAGPRAPDVDGQPGSSHERGERPTLSGPVAAWSRLAWPVRALLLAVVAILAIEYVSGFYGSVVGQRTVPGVPTSPYATGPAGTAAFVALLSERGDAVTVDSQPLAASSIPSGATLVVIDPTRWTTSDRTVARSVVAAGGQVVFVGAAPSMPGPTLGPGAAVTLVPIAPGPVVRTVPGALTEGVGSLDDGVGVLRTEGDVHRDVLGAHGTVVADDDGVVWVATSVPLRDANLASLDDAALAWNLGKPFGGAVVLDAADMTPAAVSTGLRALPTWVQAALLLALLAVLTWIISASRRFGPVERAARAAAPARIGHVDAMASLLSTTGSAHVAAATAALSADTRRLLVRVLHAHTAAADQDIDKDAEARGIPAWVVRAALGRPATRAAALQVGRAHAWLAERRDLR